MDPNALLWVCMRIGSGMELLTGLLTVSVVIFAFFYGCMPVAVLEWGLIEFSFGLLAIGGFGH